MYLLKHPVWKIGQRGLQICGRFHKSGLDTENPHVSVGGGGGQGDVEVFAPSPAPFCTHPK